jgi:hypothetical protein
MFTLSEKAYIDADRATLRQSFNRVPFGFAHNIHELDLFQFDSLHALAGNYQQDHFVASGAPTPGAQFYSVEYGVHTPQQAMENLDNGHHRVLMKRPENYDSRFRDLLNRLFEQVVDLRGGLGGQRVVRLESSVLVSSAASITPFHFDPEISFFFQVGGEKIYHLYTPSSVAETELEEFYRMGVVNIGQLDFEKRDPAAEHVFTLTPGLGMHQPENCPHWVETCSSRSISYVFSFETEATRSLGRTRAFNHYMRKVGLKPGRPGTSPALDALKSKTMQVAIPVRRGVGTTLRKALGR